MNTQKSLTILMPVYNSSATLDRALTSLQKQTYQHFSILCVNDGSSDKSQFILEKWQNIFGSERFHIITQSTNRGITQSLNTGINHIITDFIARLDADDWWHEKKLEKQMDFLSKHPDYGLIGCSYQNVMHGKIYSIHCKETDSEIRQFIFRRNPFAHSAVVFDATLAKKLGGYSESVFYGQDYDLWFRFLHHTKVYNLPEFLCYRNADSGISYDKQNDQMRQCLRTQWKYLREYQRSWWEYRFLLEPLLVILTPQWIKRLKRTYL